MLVVQPWPRYNNHLAMYTALVLVVQVFWYFYSQVEFVLVLGSVRIQIFQKFATRLQTSCLHSFEESSTQDAEESKAHDGPERTCSQERAATQFSAQLKSCASLPACNQAATRSSFSNYLGVQDLPLLGDPFAAKNGTWVVKEISQRKNASRIHQIAGKLRDSLAFRCIYEVHQCLMFLILTA